MISRNEALQQVADTLSDPTFSQAVDLVAWVADGDRDGTHIEAITVANSAGRCVLTRDDPAGLVLAGEHPLSGDYPLAWQRLARYFADPRSADIAVCRGPATPSHNVGEHGGLDGQQSRAPMLISGPGAPRHPPRAHQARLIDLAPTIATIAGTPTTSWNSPATDEHPAGSGHAVESVETATGPVLAVLWDGVGDSALRQAHHTLAMPGLTQLLQRRHAWYDGGAIAEFPTLTMVNHTSALCGWGTPGHGIHGNHLHDHDPAHAFESADPGLFHRIADAYRSGTTTLWDTVPETVMTACINEMTDQGATRSTFAPVRADLEPIKPLLELSAEQRVEVAQSAMQWLMTHITEFAHPTITAKYMTDAGYAKGSVIDLWGLRQIQDTYQTPTESPRIAWWSSYVTDIATHAGGPGSDIALSAICDSDARLAELIDHLRATGQWDDLTVILTADHGAAPHTHTSDGDWQPSVTAALHGSGWQPVMAPDNMIWLRPAA